ncbi:MAG: thiamine phosphate synthase [Gemmataceae bacterium]
MTLPEHTAGVARALEVAAAWASCMGAAQVEHVHVLLALVQEEEGRVATLLSQRGITPAKLRTLLQAGDRDLEPLQAPARIPLAPDVETTLHVARRLAAEWSGERIVSTGHLLAALLERDAYLRDLLGRVGFFSEDVEKELRAEATELVMDTPLDLHPTREEWEVHRILDANANRAREALRVLEDYCRFGLDDPYLTGELKQMRHELTHVLQERTAPETIRCRDTPGDIGPAIHIEAASGRQRTEDVIVANFRRLQEALRSLEEYAQVALGGELASWFQKMRYRAYTLEGALASMRQARARLEHVRLYLLVSGQACAASLEFTVREAIAGGVQMVQLREKSLADRDLIARARQVRRWTYREKVPLIVNDRADIAALVEADGVHVGQEDLAAAEVRRILGPQAIVGVSTHNIEQLHQAIIAKADYVGAGPVFPSRTKDFTELAGLDYVRQAAQRTALPVFAIGGISLDNLPLVLATGIRRVAVGHAICQSEDPRAAAEKFRALLDSAASADSP